MILLLNFVDQTRNAAYAVEDFMTFEFALIALIEGQLPLELKRYEDTIPLYCLDVPSLMIT